MSLDKWIKSDKEKNDQKTIKKNSQVKNTKKSVESNKSLESEKRSLKKFRLNCSKKNCNYQKLVMKRELSDKDLICPRCKGKMKINNI